MRVSLLKEGEGGGKRFSRTTLDGWEGVWKEVNVQKEKYHYSTL